MTSYYDVYSNLRSIRYKRYGKRVNNIKRQAADMYVLYKIVKFVPKQTSLRRFDMLSRRWNEYLRVNLPDNEKDCHLFEIKYYGEVQREMLFLEEPRKKLLEKAMKMAARSTNSVPRNVLNKFVLLWLDHLADMRLPKLPKGWEIHTINVSYPSAKH